MAAAQVAKRIVFITGANSGIGFEASKILAQPAWGSCRLIIACRNEAKAREAMATIQASQGQAELDFLPLDMSSLASVRACYRTFVERFGPEAVIDSLLLNAGQSNFKATSPEMTEDGFEVTFQANYLSNFLLTHLMLPHLERSRDGRVVLVSSAFHDPDRRMDLKPLPALANSSYAPGKQLTKPVADLDRNDLQRLSVQPYSGQLIYATSKLLTVMFVYELQRRLDAVGSHVRCYLLSPGFIPGTAFFRNAPSLLQWVARWLLDFALKPVLRMTRTPFEGGLALARLAREPLKDVAPMPAFLATSEMGGVQPTAGYYRLTRDNLTMEPIVSSDRSYHLQDACWLYDESAALAHCKDVVLGKP